MSQPVGQTPERPQPGAVAAAAVVPKSRHPFLGLFVAVAGYAAFAVPIFATALLGLIGTSLGSGSGVSTFLCNAAVLCMLASPVLAAMALSTPRPKMRIAALLTGLPALLGAVAVHETIGRIQG